MDQLWYFLLYSFLGFLLETGYACLVGGDPDRKCLLLLPLCPVYGLGVYAVLLLPGWVLRSVPALVLLGGLTATAVEYGVSLLYQKLFSVSFWNYAGYPWNLDGRVCLPFSLAWGLLLVPAVRLVHPWAARFIPLIPAPVSWAVLAALLSDLLVSSLVLRRTGDTRRLRWYRLRPGERSAAPEPGGGQAKKQPRSL